MRTLAFAAPNPQPGLRRRRCGRPWLLALAAWTLFTAFVLWWLFHAGQAVTGSSRIFVHGGDPAQLSWGERTRDWFRLVHVNFARIYPWILFGPYVVWLASRFHLERGRLRLNAAILLAGCAVFAGACYAVNSHVSAGIGRVIVLTTHEETIGLTNGSPHKMQMMKMEISGAAGGSLLTGEDVPRTHHFYEMSTGVVHGSTQEMAARMPSNLWPKLEAAMKPPGPASAGTLMFSPLPALLDVFAYGSLAGLAHAFHFYGRYRERERRALFLESNLAKARLNTLQAQLQPHFLFNTLNAIATLLRRDPRAAEITLMSLSELLRLALSQSDKQEIPLCEEIRFLERYMEIQQTRFGERLSFEQQIDSSSLNCLVPTLILQPLVENAIRHGLEPSADPGTVRVTARRQEGKLVITVEDDGIGLSSTTSVANGIGLSNLRARLETLYAADQELKITGGAERGVNVRIEIPYHEVAFEEDGRDNAQA